MLLVRCNIFYESLHYPSSVLLSRQAEMQDENTGCLCFTDQPSCCLLYTSQSLANCANFYKNSVIYNITRQENQVK